MSESEAAGDKVLLEIDSWINLNRRFVQFKLFSGCAFKYLISLKCHQKKKQ